MTFFYKVAFPTLWIGGFLVGTVSMLLAGHPHDNGRGALPPPALGPFLGAFIAGSSLILWLNAGLKRVRLNGASLEISNYRKEIVVPLTEISEVTENRWVNIHPVTLHFRHATEFGTAVVFMPPARLFGFFSSHPVVKELRSLVVHELSAR